MIPFSIDEVSQRYLDLSKINILSTEDKSFIYKAFNDLSKCFDIAGVSNPIGAQLIFNTLVENGYLVTRRETNLNTILD